jgi:hypothetical protein
MNNWKSFNIEVDHIEKKIENPMNKTNKCGMISKTENLKGLDGIVE